MADHSANAIVSHYNKADEASRLVTGWFQLEQARTQELILRHIPPPPGRVLDVGGGAGAYALWLARLGYQVHLIDAVPRHIEQALAASAKQTQHPLASAVVGDARKLEQVDHSADAVLLLGPIYHLTERKDRIAALREAHRVLRAKGRVWVAGISRFASLVESIGGGFFDRPEFAPILDRDLAEGQQRNPTDNLMYFTDARFFTGPRNWLPNSLKPALNRLKCWPSRARDGWRGTSTGSGTISSGVSVCSLYCGPSNTSLP